MNIIFILITVLSSVLASMGVGGGGLFIILGTIFLNMDQKQMQLLNLFMFVASGIVASISNFKSKSILKKEFIKIIPFLLIGIFLGNNLVKNVDSNKLQVYFTIFMLIIGVYEIISSLIKITKAKNSSIIKGKEN